MMDYQRYQAEVKVLTDKGVPFRFFDLDRNLPYVLMAAKTNQGTVYKLRMDLDDFPYDKPFVSTTEVLYTKSGKPMTDCSGHMHCLSSPYGTGICHYGGAWNPSISLYKVFIKCRLWLEMYELHLQTGMPIEYYLKEDKS